MDKTKFIMILIIIFLACTSIFFYFAWGTSFDSMQEQGCRADCCSLGYEKSLIKERFCHCFINSNESFSQHIIIDRNFNIFDAETKEWLNP